MVATETIEYRDVFIEHTMNSTNLSIAVGIAFFSIFIIGILFALFSPETRLVTKIISVGAVTLALTVAPIGYIILSANNSNQVIDNMEFNVKQKYNQELSLSLNDIGIIKDRSELNRYNIVVRSGQVSDSYVLVPYAISFDRETNEPTLEEIEAIKIPTADEIAKAAQK